MWTRLSFVSLVGSLAVLGMLCASCGSHDGASSSGPMATSRASAEAAERDESAAGTAPSPTGPSTADPTGSVGLRAEPRAGGEVAAILEARRPASVRAALRVEHLENGRWSSVPVQSLSLRADCEARAPTSCVTLREGGALHPPAWNGTLEHGQCGCDGGCRKTAAGEYRFVVESCDGARAIAGEPFRYAP